MDIEDKEEYEPSYAFNNKVDRKSVSINSSEKNKYQNMIDLAYAIDAWRIFPRIFISVYIYLVYAVVVWFMALENPSTQQAGLVSVMTGVGAAWFGLYTKTKGDGQ